MKSITVKPSYSWTKFLATIITIVVITYLDTVAVHSTLHLFLLPAGIVWCVWYITNQTRCIVLKEGTITESFLMRKHTISYSQIDTVDLYQSQLYGSKFIRLAFTDSLEKRRKMTIVGDVDIDEICVLINTRRFKFDI